MFSKKEYLRRCQAEQEANGRVFQDFLETFQTEVSTVKTKTWVKAGSFDAGTGREDESEKGTIYEPKPLLKGRDEHQSTIKTALECARIVKDKKNERLSSRKHTSNLEALKEEIKQRHIERQKVKESPPICNSNQAAQDILDPNSTNLYIGNISPKLTENDLIQMFGAYGALASVKIMWPRGEDNNNRNSHCGFVAYMSRKDAERAYDAMKQSDIKVSWGKFVDVPQFPIYVPPELQSLTDPPPFSGLPFNAQPINNSHRTGLYNSTVKVSIPTDKKLLGLIHRVIEFVIREGPLFEAVIMNREIKNPLFKFLFDNTSAAHTYYRWKLYSLMNGEAIKDWSTAPFRMFAGGSVWIPPTSLDYSKGMPAHILEKNGQATQPRLSETQCKRFVRFLRDLSLKRFKIGETMVFCLNHAECSAEIVEYIAQSLSNSTTNAQKKLARLFLISDILCNCNIKTVKNERFRSDFEQELPEIFAHMRKSLDKLNFSCDREAFKTRVIKVLREWDLWKIYPDEFLNKLENIFHQGNVAPEKHCESDSDLSEDDSTEHIPLPKAEHLQNVPGFIPSRWETVDPEEVEAQAMSTKKFYHMEMQRKNEEHQAAKKKKKSSDPVPQKCSDRRRRRLRELELLVLEYQDELETGHKKLRKGATLEQEVNRYRAKLMRAMDKSDSSGATSDDFERGRVGKNRGKVKKLKGDNRKRHKSVSKCH